MMARHHTVRHPHTSGTHSNSSDRRTRHETLRKVVESLHSMQIPDNAGLKLTYRVDGRKLMAFGLSGKAVAELSVIEASELRYMNPGELQKKVAELRKKKEFKFVAYELDMRKFLRMVRIDPQLTGVFAACNSELFPDHDRGVSVEMYAKEHNLDEGEARKMLETAEKEFLVRSD